MAKQMIEVEIPDGTEVTSSEWVNESGDLKVGGHMIIRVHLRKVWQWPEWLADNWIAMDKSRKWYAFEDEPNRAVSVWVSPSSRYLGGPFFHFVPPPCDDWTKSKRKRPGA